MSFEKIVCKYVFNNSYFLNTGCVYVCSNYSNIPQSELSNICQIF